MALVALFSSLGTRAIGAETLRVMSYNVRNGRGMDNKVDYPRIAEIIQKNAPDVVALQELDYKTSRSQGVDVLSEIASLSGMYPTYGAAIDFQGGKYGVGILSKEKPIRVETTPLPGREERRVLLCVELENYVVFCSHWSLTEEDRNSTVAIIANKKKLNKGKKSNTKTPSSFNKRKKEGCHNCEQEKTIFKTHISLRRFQCAK